jgi:DNA-binding response OmpR family regulator
LYSVLGEVEDHVRGFAAGANAYLAKSCNARELLDTVEDLLQPA